MPESIVSDPYGQMTTSRGRGGAYSGAALARSAFLAASVSSMLRILYCRDRGTSCMPVSHDDTSCCLIFCPCHAQTHPLSVRALLAVKLP